MTIYVEMIASNKYQILAIFDEGIRKN